MAYVSLRERGPTDFERADWSGSGLWRAACEHTVVGLEYVIYGQKLFIIIYYLFIIYLLLLWRRLYMLRVDQVRSGANLVAPRPRGLGFDPQRLGFKSPNDSWVSHHSLLWLSHAKLSNYCWQALASKGTFRWGMLCFRRSTEKPVLIRAYMHYFLFIYFLLVKALSKFWWSILGK